MLTLSIGAPSGNTDKGRPFLSRVCGLGMGDFSIGRESSVEFRVLRLTQDEPPESAAIVWMLFIRRSFVCLSLSLKLV